LRNAIKKTTEPKYPKTNKTKKSNLFNETTQKTINVKKAFGQTFAILLSLGLGAFLIETHHSVGQTLLGLILWGFAILLTLPWFPTVPSMRIFPKTILQNQKPQHVWNFPIIILLCVGILGLIGASNYLIQHGIWWLLLAALLALGGLFSLLEKHSYFLGDTSEGLSQAWYAKFPWPIIIIILVGSFFIFYGHSLFPIGYDTDSAHSLDLCNSFLVSNGKKTPYVDGWALGEPIFPYFLVGLFLKVVGFSNAKAVLFIALFNLIGFLFFYGFLRFYLSKISALATTILFTSSYWVLLYARIMNAVSLLIPFECAALFFFAKAAEQGKARDYAVFGTLLSCLLMVYTSGRIFPFFFIICLLMVLVFRSKVILSQKYSWALAGGVFLLWYLPMIVYYQHTTNPYCFGFEEFFKDRWFGNKFVLPWGNIHIGLQMLTVRTTDAWADYLPRLSPWEGLLLLAGFGWCLWRLLKPAYFFLILGFFMCLATVLSNIPTLPYRTLAIAPFVYALVGIGLDRLGKVIAAPLGNRGAISKYLFLGTFLAFSIGWQYDVFFHQLPKDKDLYWSAGRGQRYLIGNTTAQYINGWDTFMDTTWGIYQPIASEGGFTYSRSEIQDAIWKRIIFRADRSPLPLKSDSKNGAVIFLHDDFGKAFGDWINYYYPDVHPQLITNPFGDVEIRLWKISHPQIQQALSSHKGHPPGGLILSWYDVNNHRLGRWRIPTLSSKILNDEWFSEYPGVEPPFPWKKVSYFIVEGSIKNIANHPFAIDTTGQIEGVVDGKIIRLSGQGNIKRLKFRSFNEEWTPFNIRYSPQKQGEFALDLLRHTPMGWEMIPSPELKPLFKGGSK
jgi:hypothetical protein